MKFSEVIKNLGEAKPGATDPEIARVCEDSRKVRAGDLFVARDGGSASGAQFAADAVAKGAVAIVSEKPIEVPAKIAFAQVENAGEAMALMAHRVAGNPAAKMTLLGVTGTKGKTTVGFLMRSILKRAGKKCGLIGTVQIDDGKTIEEASMTTPGAIELVEMLSRMRDNGVTHVVMEVSSHALAQGRVAGMNFSVGMFTNLTGDHLDYHKTMDEYAAAKKLLFANLSADATAVVNIDDAYAGRMVEDVAAKVTPYCVARQGDARPAPSSTGGGWTAEIRRMASDGMLLRILNSAGESFELRTPLVGRHNAYNLLCVIAASRAIGIDNRTIIAALENEPGAPGRLQAVVPQGTKRDDLPFQVFVDYAHTHDSLENVLTALRGTMAAEDRRGRLICVFGCGGDRDRTKRPKMAAVAEKNADKVIVTSDNPRTEEPEAIINEIVKGFSETGLAKVLIEADRREAIKSAIAGAEPGDVVLIAGKGHENYQIVGKTKHHFDDVEEATKALAEGALVARH